METFFAELLNASTYTVECDIIMWRMVENMQNFVHCAWLDYVRLHLDSLGIRNKKSNKKQYQ